MTNEQIKKTIENVNAMTEIATGIKTTKENNELAEKMLKGELPLNEALRQSKENIRKKYSKEDK